MKQQIIDILTGLKIAATYDVPILYLDEDSIEIALENSVFTDREQEILKMHHWNQDGGSFYYTTP
jgi:hypothetical protein